MVSSSSCELAAIEKSPSVGDPQHEKVAKAQEKYHAQLPEENKGEEDEQKKEEEEEEEEIDGARKEDSGEEMCKLDEKFYEVEAICKKRNHKGQLQYLIKWRNYPETANTWEPYDNIKCCTDMLDAFEQSLQKRKRKSALRKMKRSIQTEDGGDGAITQIGGDRDNKRSGGRALTIERDIPILRRNPERNIKSLYKKEKKMLEDENGKEKFTEDEAKTNEIPVPLPKAKGVEEMNEGGTNFVMQDYVRKWREKEEAKAGVGAAAMAIFLPNCKADIAADGEAPPVGPMSYLYSDFEPQSSKEAKRLIGAARGKAGRVTRFVHPDELAKKVMNVELAESTEAASTASAVAVNTAIGSNNKTAQEEFHITEILEPVQLSAISSPTTGNISHVCITFKALRSDGTQVLVNNRELRATNPLLLIDFYEKHLRYTPDP